MWIQEKITGSFYREDFLQTMKIEEGKQKSIWPEQIDSDEPITHSNGSQSCL